MVKGPLKSLLSGKIHAVSVIFRVLRFGAGCSEMVSFSVREHALIKRIWSERHGCD